MPSQPSRYRIKYYGIMCQYYKLNVRGGGGQKVFKLSDLDDILSCIVIKKYIDLVDVTKVVFYV